MHIYNRMCTYSSSWLRRIVSQGPNPKANPPLTYNCTKTAPVQLRAIKNILCTNKVTFNLNFRSQGEFAGPVMRLIFPCKQTSSNVDSGQNELGSPPNFYYNFPVELYFYMRSFILPAIEIKYTWLIYQATSRSKSLLSTTEYLAHSAVAFFLSVPPPIQATLDARCSRRGRKSQ